MITLTIDNQSIQVADGTTILAAAAQLGIHIPTLCYADGFKPSTSCMVCVVQVEGLKSLVPACGTRAAEGMAVRTDTPQVRQARKTAIELLLSDHIGDCEAPCEFGCPSNMDIPEMIRHIAAGDFDAAIRTIKADIPLPAVCGRICPAPCEKVCRRKQADDAVSICLLKRLAADTDLAKETPYTPECPPLSGKKVAVIGAGPAGLSAAYYLRQAGIGVTVYDDHDTPGGALRYADIDRTLLPVDIVDREIERIFKLGIEFHGNIRLGRDVSLAELKSQYEAVLIAVGPSGVGANKWDIDTKDDRIQVDRQQYTTSLSGIFAAGGCIGSRNLCIRAIADGKEAARAIQSHLTGSELPSKPYQHRMGPVNQEGLDVFLKHASREKRTEPKCLQEGLTRSQAQEEAARCLHCDCRKAGRCGLRDRATELAARQKTWQGQTTLFEQITADDAVIYEPGKCIKCGLCVQCAAQKRAAEATQLRHSKNAGLTFTGRGFDMEIAMPLKKALGQMPREILIESVNICPTGALVM